MSLTTFRPILTTNSPGGPGSSGPLITDIEVPQLTFANASLRSAGVEPIRFGDLFRSRMGREPEPGEYVRFNFSSFSYRGAFGWSSRSSVFHRGVQYAVVAKPRASFLLGAGWLPGQTPAQIEINIPSSCQIWTASGIPSRPTSYSDFNTMDAVVTSVFSLQGTEAFINQTTPLIFNHKGNIWLAGGTGAGGGSYSSYVGTSGGAAFFISETGGCGKGWPHCPHPSQSLKNDASSIDIYQDTVLGGTSLVGPGIDGGYITFQSYSGFNSSNVGTITWYLGDGGSYGQVGRGSFGTFSAQGSLPTGSFSGTLPAALFDLGDNAASRFINWNNFSPCIDVVGATGRVNNFLKSSWWTAPAWNSGNPTWSWKHGIFRDGLGTIQPFTNNARHIAKLFGSDYHPLGFDYWFRPVAMGQASPYSY